MKIKTKIILFSAFLLIPVAMRIILLPVGDHRNSHRSDQNGYYDYQGVIHFHTSYSEDATGSFEEIAEAANRQNIDFMISTDHNTLKPVEDKKEGWYHNTLILAGEELSLPEGYLLALNVRKLPGTPGQKTEMIISDIVQQGGLAFIAHPRHPRWKWTMAGNEGIIGEEILDLADQWYKASPASLFLSLIYYPVNSSAAFMQLYDRPGETLKEWDKKTQNHPFVGIFAPDFHQAVRISGNYKIPFPGVEKILPVAHDHIILPIPFSGNFLRDKEVLYEAIRKGHLYFSVDLLQNASGFLFSAKQSHQSAWMGDQIPSGNETLFSVKLPDPVSFRHFLIRLYRNGEEIAHTGEPTLSFRTKQAGVYRVEVEVEISTFWGLSRRVVWIYSNPIYLR